MFSISKNWPLCVTLGAFFLSAHFIAHFKYSIFTFNKPFSYISVTHCKMVCENIMGLAINFIGFQIGWFACVIGAAQGYPLVAVAVASIIVSLASIA
jgi:hypothetical protein